MPSRVCHLFAQCSINASTSDCVSASFCDSALKRLLKSKTKTNGVQEGRFLLKILSVMPYTASYFGLSSIDLNYLCQAVKFILGRHWIEAEIFPYILRNLGISVLLDPALSAAVAATGLYFREGNKHEDLWLEHSDSSGCNLRQKAIVRDLLQLWFPYIQLSDIAASLTAHKNGATGRLDRLKKVLQAWCWLPRLHYERKLLEKDGARVFQLNGWTL